VSERKPPFDELVDHDDLDRARLLRVHEYLVVADPPAEMPPSLDIAPPEPRGNTVAFPRRRSTVLAAAAIAAVTLLGVGYAIGGRDSPPAPVRTISMQGAAGATASLDLLPKDAAGNWPMTLAVTGLPPLPKSETYTLWLTKDGKLAESCGSFTVAAGTTTVPLNAPYPLRQFDGWVIVRTGSTRPFLLRTDTA